MSKISFPISIVFSIKWNNWSKNWRWSQWRNAPSIILFNYFIIDLFQILINQWKNISHSRWITSTKLRFEKIFWSDENLFIEYDEEEFDDQWLIFTLNNLLDNDIHLKIIQYGWSFFGRSIGQMNEADQHFIPMFFSSEDQIFHRQFNDQTSSSLRINRRKILFEYFSLISSKIFKSLNESS